MHSEPDIWTLLFEQTPVVIRFILGVLTLGMFTLAGMLWRWNRQDLSRVETQLHARMDRMESKVDNGFEQVNQNIMKMSRQG